MLKKPGLSLEWEDRLLKMDCRLANYITFGDFKKDFDERNRDLIRGRKRRQPYQIFDGRGSDTTKRPRRGTANYGNRSNNR
ncbi:hypothetical protein V865_007479 [Kwoniella europaea PYCC6329]|uniref:Uncharacterized protein n=1 Tax=Kwoniella europaea PYCC6329 TaxID=1423913 RepID=A0AAX4KSB2_9TREE